MASSGGDSTHTVKLRLNITGFDCEPEEITKILMIEPDETWLQGQTVRSGSRVTYKSNGWRVGSPQDGKQSSFTEQLSALKQHLLPALENFRNLPKGTQRELSCIVYGFEYVPPIGFEAEEVEFIASLGCSIDIDLSDLTASRDELGAR